MKIISTILLVLVSFGISLYVYVNSIIIDEAAFGSRYVILFILPGTLLLVLIQLLLMPKLIKNQTFYSRYKDGFENIFLSLTFLLFLLHGGILLVATGVDFQILRLIPIIVGVVLVTTANTLPRFIVDVDQQSKNLPQTMNEAWNVILRPFSLPLFIGGIILVMCAFLPSQFILFGFLSVLVVTLIISFTHSYRAYKLRMNFKK
ncbi:hypothetical protein [Halalkalibacter hemicellulosilyticus]|uniref:Uncharacterized protein n=1 Tax=Halalkalibacter hemicellulosilyticusJCM 9152 TaxID=1236971 RepID=W4QKD2_9BACI|nr:hypothetical protein [Halalkalibacter hemicellulosilyticus]GAE32536.1 hypothetical protein JCM9152_4073 [Halalkalibacter hemicellulosilyticusJCM 9152]